MEQISGLHDQDRRAVFHQGPSGDVLDPAELRVERLNDELSFSEESIDDEPERVEAVTEDDDRQFVANDIRSGESQHLMTADESDRAPFEVEMLAPFHQLQLCAWDLHGS